MEKLNNLTNDSNTDQTKAHNRNSHDNKIKYIDLITHLGQTKSTIKTPKA